MFGLTGKSVCALLAAITLAAPLRAGTVTFTGSSGNLAASAKFEASGSNLIVTLSNTSTADVMNNAECLAAVFWDVVDASNVRIDLNLTPISGILGLTSSVVYGGSTSNVPAANSVGGEFGYAEGATNLPGLTQANGISAAGFGVPYVSLFPGGELANNGGTPPDGPGYTILSAGDNLATGNGGLTGKPRIKHEVIFTLSGLSGGFDPSTQIKNVRFQYGTALNEPSFGGTPAFTPPSGGPTAVPAPAAVWGGLVLLSGLGVYRRVMMRR